jgi:hypothetical protein
MLALRDTRTPQRREMEESNYVLVRDVSEIQVSTVTGHIQCELRQNVDADQTRKVPN